MREDDNSSFDRLVAGISSEDRQKMLSQIQAVGQEPVTFVTSEDEKAEFTLNLTNKLKSESVFYRFFIFLRAFIIKEKPEKIYNNDLLNDISKNVIRLHPNLINNKTMILESIFYERLKALQEAAVFFKPYFTFIKDDFGAFYVFLGSIVVPDYTESIEQEADPFLLGFDREATPELRNQLLKKVDDFLKNIPPDVKHTLYEAVNAVNWLMLFSELPFNHFISQFTDFLGTGYSCPYMNARNDYNMFASLFANIRPVSSDVLQAICLFSQRKASKSDYGDKNVSRIVSDFLVKANTCFSVIQDFVYNVPVLKIGKIINNDYEWNPENPAGAESWFVSYKTQWKKTIEVRWNEWNRERKKRLLATSLKTDFHLESFPYLPYRPWTEIWSKVSFSCDLVAGFMCWFAKEKYQQVVADFKIILLEGLFMDAENKAEYAEGISEFSSANLRIREIESKLASGGEWRHQLEQYEATTVKTIQIQTSIDNLFKQIQNEIRDVLMDFGKGSRMIEAVLKGIFDDEKDGVHEGLQNFSSIGGRSNFHIRDQIQASRFMLKKALYYISELEQIDSYSDF